MTTERVFSERWFEGFTREHWVALLEELTRELEGWESSWPAFEPMTGVDVSEARDALFELASRLQENLPYFHPLYAGHMLKPPHPVAWVAYALTALINPNNQTREVGEATTKMELEVVSQLAEMLGMRHTAGHLTTSGTIANLEAMWVARQSHPGRALACSSAAHYNYSRISNLLGVRLVELPCGPDETIDVSALGELIEREDIGTVAASLGTTGLGVVDPLHEIVEVAHERDCRVHVDAAYGGFFSLVAPDLGPVERAAFGAIGDADSVTIDPHKHGLQPYGCGCILYREPQDLHHFLHDSPYTYQDRDALHMGQIQLECSRSGAAAAALWATLRVLPLTGEAGMAPILGACRRAALGWAEAIEESPWLRTVVPPHLDIVSFVVWPSERETMSTSQLSGWTRELIAAGQHDDDRSFYLTRYDLDTSRAAELLPGLIVDTERVSVLRSCVMKPEHETWWPTLHQQISESASKIAGG